MLRLFLMVICFGCLSLSAMAQSKTVTGTVYDSSNEPLIGASVQLKGNASVAALTNIDGMYSLVIPKDGTLVISYVGYQTQEVATAGKTTIDVVLKENANVLDEVVAVGYGTQKKSDVTGAMVRVGEKELQARPVTNAFEAMQGKAAGVDITTNERPGTIGSIRIRGERSLTASNEPLYVVDGVPLMSGSGIETINPRDIESIDILKDASATAIYGSRGANGVVIVTTKQGQPGKFNISYSGSITWQRLQDKSPAVSAADFITYRRWAAYNADPTKYADPRHPTKESDAALFGIIDDQTAYNNVMNGWKSGSWNPADVTEYDWTGQALRTGVAQEHTVSVTGGTDKMNSFASFGFLGDKGTQKGQSYNRYTARVGTNISPNKYITVSMSFNASYEKQQYGMSSQFASSPSNSANALYGLYKRNYRWALPYDENGERVKYPGGDNMSFSPINEWEHNVSDRETYRILGSFSATLHIGEIFKPLQGLDYKFAFGPDYRNWRQGDFIDADAAYKFWGGSPNQARWQQVRDFSWTLDNMLTYNRTFDKVHRVGLTLLQTASSWNRENASMGINRLEQNMYLWNAMGSLDITDKENKASMSTGLTERQLESYMIRVNYAFADKYLLTASARWDGASQLSAGRKWEFFPSMSLGWRVSEESFLNDIHWINNLKLRAGVGTTGNSAISPYATLGQIQSYYVPTMDGYDKAYTVNDPAFTSSTLVMANTKVGWEKTTQWNVGIDYGFLNNRVFGSLEFYKSKTKDLLLNMSVPTVTGYASTIANIGETSNKGVEIALTAIPVQTRDFQWTSTVNMAWQKDRIDALSNGKEDDIANRWFIGQQLGVYYDYLTDGLWQDTPADLAEIEKWNANGYKFAPGMVKPVDQPDKDGNYDYKMDDNDRVIIGNTRPNVTAGWSNEFTYKNIQLGIHMYGRFNYWVQQAEHLYGYGNLGTRALDYWTPDNTGAIFQRPYLTSVQTGDADQFASQNGYTKANFIRVRNISVAYLFDNKLLKNTPLTQAKVYAQVINPFDIWQSVKGFDLDTGNTYFNRSWVIGVEVSF